MLQQILKRYYYIALTNNIQFAIFFIQTVCKKLWVIIHV